MFKTNKSGVFFTVLDHLGTWGPPCLHDGHPQIRLKKGPQLKRTDNSTYLFEKSLKTRMGNRYQARSEVISSSFSSSQSNCDVTSFPRKQFLQNFIVGTDQPTNRPTNQHSLLWRRYFAPKKHHLAKLNGINGQNRQKW
jgi:hypothetical protein